MWICSMYLNAGSLYASQRTCASLRYCCYPLYTLSEAGSLFAGTYVDSGASGREFCLCLQFPTEALRLKMYDLALWGLWEFKFRCSCHEVSTLNHLLIVCMWACVNVCVYMPWHACGSWRTTYGHQFCLSTTACARGIGLRPSGFTCWATSAGPCLFFKSTAELRLKVQTCNPSF